jgi:DNA repair exonuclease SbcCD ATPase subunit
MAEKPRRARVRKIIKNLLDSEIPEIQSIANKLAEQIKELEEQSSKLQEYVNQIENITSDDANAMTESRIVEILNDLDVALKELRQRPRRTLATSAEVRAVAPKKRAVKEEEEEQQEEEEEEEEVEEGIASGHMLERVITPEGYVIKKMSPY